MIIDPVSFQLSEEKERASVISCYAFMILFSCFSCRNQFESVKNIMKCLGDVCKVYLICIYIKFIFLFWLTSLLILFSIGTVMARPDVWRVCGPPHIEVHLSVCLSCIPKCVFVYMCGFFFSFSYFLFVTCSMYAFFLLVGSLTILAGKCASSFRD